MKFTKTVIDNLSKCYSIAPLPSQSSFRFLVAAEKHDPCYLYDENGTRLETVWTEPGGVMTMVQVPGQSDQFLATHKFYSPNDSKEAKIVIATKRSENDWEIRTLVDAPFVHRFGILERNGMTWLVVCCLKSGHEYKDDWTKAGAVFAAPLPQDLSVFHKGNQLPLKLIQSGMCHNHGYSTYCDNGINTAVITCDEGVFQFIPPESVDADWTIRCLLEAPVSEAVLCDFDGDGKPELGCIAPFHGDQLYICHLNDEGIYEKVWQYPEPCEMLHATWTCTLLGKPAWVVGYRKGKRNLMVVTYEDGYHVDMIDKDCGPANTMKFVNSKGQDVLVAANRETDEIALYIVSK